MDSHTPLLKWPGGKRRLVRSILPLLPKSFGRYYEPFLGGGALFFALQPRRAFISDNNCDLICTYKVIRDNPGSVIELLAGFKNSEVEYYALRSAIPKGSAERAARLIYLSTLAFNGIHRVNRRGQFNVPYGQKKHLEPCNQERIYAASQLLQNAIIRCADFEAAVETAQRNDLVYMDPPYTVAHGHNGFLKYNARIFSWSDQERLATVARELNDRGCFVIISNADHPSIRRLYRGFRVLEIQRHSIIAAAGNFRRLITECIFYKGRSENAK